MFAIQHNQNNEVQDILRTTEWQQIFSTDSLKEKTSDTFNLRRLYLAIHFLDGYSSLRLVFKAHKPKTMRSSSLPVTGSFHCKSTTAQIVVTYGLPLLWKLIGQVILQYYLQSLHRMRKRHLWLLPRQFPMQDLFWICNMNVMVRCQHWYRMLRHWQQKILKNPHSNTPTNLKPYWQTTSQVHTRYSWKAPCHGFRLYLWKPLTLNPSSCFKISFKSNSLRSLVLFSCVSSIRTDKLCCKWNKTFVSEEDFFVFSL